MASLPIKIDTAYMSIQIDAYAWPIEARGDLLNVRGFARAVVPLHEHPPVVHESGQDRQCRIWIET